MNHYRKIEIAKKKTSDCCFTFRETGLRRFVRLKDNILQAQIILHYWRILQENMWQINLFAFAISKNHGIRQSI